VGVYPNRFSYGSWWLTKNASLDWRFHHKPHDRLLNQICKTYSGAMAVEDVMLLDMHLAAEFHRDPHCHSVRWAKKHAVVDFIQDKSYTQVLNLRVQQHLWL
jgi:hypothetical protein